MRKIALATTGVLLSVGLLSPIQAFAIDDVNTAKLRKAVTVSGILQHERALQRIANQNDGTRASGTPGFAASADYVVKKLRKAGYKVKRQTFTFPFFRDVGAFPILSELTPTKHGHRDRHLRLLGQRDVDGTVIPTNDIVRSRRAPSQAPATQAAKQRTSRPRPTAMPSR